MQAPIPTAAGTLRLPSEILPVPVRRGLARARAGVAACRHWLSGITPERWFVVLLVLALAGFVLALLLQPGAVGRGGR